MAKEAEMDTTVIWFDQAMYAKAVDVQASKPNEFSSVVLGLGPFHNEMQFLGIIGKRFKDAGLEDMLIQSGNASAR